MTITDANMPNDLVSMMRSLCCNPDNLTMQSRRGIRNLSCLPHQISEASKHLLDSLDKMITEPSADRPEPLQISTAIAGPNISNIPAQKLISTSRLHTQAIYPIMASNKMPKLALKPPFKKALSSKDRVRTPPTILLESLEAVFTTECIIGTAYLETFMPSFYSSYMILMVHLPNVKYHIEMEGVTRDNVRSTVLPLFVFCLLQILSFLLMARVIKRNCGMEALYQLAFVLETQRSLIHCKMMLWMVITLCFRVTHFGTSRFVVDFGAYLATKHRYLQVLTSSSALRDWGFQDFGSHMSRIRAKPIFQAVSLEPNN
ncbi:unnamed protein product [Phytophthora fragariaefolia]|uniref:Unnamed protein product n=1 Tax=Phytophthora fragariaefolia TaxID=1490495 RepID=A0A9W6Y2G5_9STRA|nr:unnamed protein product [Phytophthora fragariaefolia]